MSIESLQPSNKISEAEPAAQPEPTLCERILETVCCCFFKRTQIQQTTEPSVLNACFEPMGQGSDAHYILSSASSNSLISHEVVQSESLYDILNARDYEEVSDVIRRNESLPKEQTQKLLEYLDQMKEKSIFLDPELLLQQMEIPFELSKEIRFHACLAKVRHTVYPSFQNMQEGISLVQLDRALDVHFVIPNLIQFQKMFSRFPITLSEKVDSIRWGALHGYDERYKPESLNTLQRVDSEEKERNFMIEDE